jgi:hypothetical protein
MKTHPSSLVPVLLLLLGSSSAVLVDFDFRYDRVELKNGRKLENVAFRTYDTLTGRVGAVAGEKQALTLRFADLPDEIAARIRERAPVQTEDEVKAEKKEAEEAKSEARRRSRELEQRGAEAAKADRDAQRQLDVKRAEAEMQRQGRAATTVAEAAKTLATHYFTYEADRYSSAGYVFGSDVLLEDPEPVPGWTDRWRVRGKIGVQYLTRNAGAVGRNFKEFEMLIDAPAKGSPKLVDVTITRM